MLKCTQKAVLLRVKFLLRLWLRLLYPSIRQAYFFKQAEVNRRLGQFFPLISYNLNCWEKQELVAICDIFDNPPMLNNRFGVVAVGAGAASRCSSGSAKMMRPKFSNTSLKFKK
jgi:hypothetical protein